MRDATQAMLMTSRVEVTWRGCMHPTRNSVADQGTPCQSAAQGGFSPASPSPGVGARWASEARVGQSGLSPAAATACLRHPLHPLRPHSCSTARAAKHQDAVPQEAGTVCIPRRWLRTRPRCSHSCSSQTASAEACWTQVRILRVPHRQPEWRRAMAPEVYSHRVQHSWQHQQCNTIRPV